MNTITITGKLEGDPIRKETGDSVVTAIRIASGDPTPAAAGSGSTSTPGDASLAPPPATPPPTASSPSTYDDMRPRAEVCEVDGVTITLDSCEDKGWSATTNGSGSAMSEWGHGTVPVDATRRADG